METNEDSEMWAAHKAERQKKKAQNELQSLEVLERNGIEYTLLDQNSKHYRVGRFNYWPTTGKFYDPKTGEKGRGVFNLIKKIHV